MGKWWFHQDLLGFHEISSWFIAELWQLNWFRLNKADALLASELDVERMRRIVKTEIQRGCGSVIQRWARGEPSKEHSSQVRTQSGPRWGTLPWRGGKRAISFWKLQRNCSRRGRQSRHQECGRARLDKCVFGTSKVSPSKYMNSSDWCVYLLTHLKNISPWGSCQIYGWTLKIRLKPWKHQLDFVSRNIEANHFWQTKKTWCLEGTVRGTDRWLFKHPWGLQQPVDQTYVPRKPTTLSNNNLLNWIKKYWANTSRTTGFHWKIGLTY